MKYIELPKVIRKIAEKMQEQQRQLDPESCGMSDEAELMNCLARILEGKHPLKALGAPGDWGYGTPIGDALLAAYNEAQPEIGNCHFSDDQVIAWMGSYNIGGSITGGRTAMEDAATLNLRDEAF